MPDKFKIAPAIGDIAAGAIPVVGAIASAAMQRRWALKDLEAQNRYNSPKSQIERLKEAGLPLATMFGGSGGSQSDQPRSTEVDPTLGTAKGMENYYQNRLQKKQLELLDAQIYREQGDGQSAWKDAWIKNNQGRLIEDQVNWLLNSEGKDIVAPAFQSASNQVQGMIRERQFKELEKVGKELNNQIDGLRIPEKMANTDETRQRILNLVAQNKEIMQRIEGEQLTLDMRKTLYDAMKRTDGTIPEYKAVLWGILTKFFTSFK